MREAGRVAADHVGGDRIQAEYVLELKQLAQVPILSLEFGQTRLIAFDPGELETKMSVFLAHVNQGQVIVHDTRSAGGNVDEARADRPDDFQETERRSRGKIARVNAGRDQMKRQDKQRAAGQQHSVAPEKAASHVNSARRAR